MLARLVRTSLVLVVWILTRSRYWKVHKMKWSPELEFLLLAKNLVASQGFLWRRPYSQVNVEKLHRGSTVTCAVWRIMNVKVRRLWKKILEKLVCGFALPITSLLPLHHCFKGGGECCREGVYAHPCQPKVLIVYPKGSLLQSLGAMIKIWPWPTPFPCETFRGARVEWWMEKKFLQRSLAHWWPA